MRGHVGQGAARFALQRLGFDVWALPTVLLSNHPGHGRSRGEVVEADRLSALVEGLNDHGWLSRCDGVVSGYLGSPAQAVAIAAIVRRVKAVNPQALYLCDPVFGDENGAYAKLGVAEAIARELLPLADIAAPNRFELTSLTSKLVGGPMDAVNASRTLAIKEVLATSIDCGDGLIGSVMATKDGAWKSSTKRLENVPSGTGDLLSALYLAARVRGEMPATALQSATSRVHAIIVESVGADELALVRCQSQLANPAVVLTVDIVA